MQTGPTLDLGALPIGIQLKLRRMALGLKQADVAARIGVHTSRVCEAEKGRGRVKDATLNSVQRQIDAALAERELAR